MNRVNTFVAKEMSYEEVEKSLSEVAEQVKVLMSDTTIDKLAFKSGLSRSQIAKYRSGRDMLLSTFLRLLHSLETTPEVFFRRIHNSSK